MILMCAIDGGRALYIELPQPGEDVEIPTTAKVAANATVTLRRDAASGDGMVQNGVSAGSLDSARFRASALPLTLAV